MAIGQRSNMFLWLDGVEGESLDEKHPGWIELESFTWSVSNNATWQSAGTGKGGQTKNQGEVVDIALTKKIDKASVTLFQNCMMGWGINNGIISCMKLDGETRLEYFKIELQKIIVKNVSWKGIGTEEVTEDVGLNFAVFKEFYKMQTNLGMPGGVTQFGFNRETSTPI